MSARDAVDQEVQTIQRFLTEWDPLNVIADLTADTGVPDEYDSYAPAIHRLLREGYDARRLADHLQQLESESMGIKPDRQRALATARTLVDWWNSRGQATGRPAR